MITAEMLYREIKNVYIQTPPDDLPYITVVEIAFTPLGKFRPSKRHIVRVNREELMVMDWKGVSVLHSIVVTMCADYAQELNHIPDYVKWLENRESV